MSVESNLNVSLEPHLIETLRQLSSALPDALSSEVQQTVEMARSQPSSEDSIEGRVATSTVCGPLISHDLLSRISRWARSTAGKKSLHDNNLDPSAYTMIALLAGTRTSPERRFPQAGPQLGEERSQEMNDRKAVTAVVNALLSILGAGFAVWWAAGMLNWKDEWKVLLALFAAIVVAVSEAILFVIWNARRSRQPPNKLPGLHTRGRHIGEPKNQDKSGADEFSESNPLTETTTSADHPASSNVQEYMSVTNLRERTKLTAA